MNYPIKCPYCIITVDSMDSYADSKQDLRYHIQYRHPGEDYDDETSSSDLFGDSGGSGDLLGSGQAGTGS